MAVSDGKHCDRSRCVVPHGLEPSGLASPRTGSRGCFVLFVLVCACRIVTGWCGCGDHDESGTVPLLKCMLTGPAR
eukprot:scaffold306091_cov35-Tisochrysis_lutea.AAC.1